MIIVINYDNIISSMVNIVGAQNADCILDLFLDDCSL